MPDPDRQQLDDLVRQRRVEEIYSTRRNVLDLEQQIAKAVADPTAQPKNESIRQAYQLSVQQYVRVIEPVLNPPDRDWTSEYWSDSVLSEYQIPDNRYRKIVGLAEFVELPLAEPIKVPVEDTPNEDFISGSATRTQVRYDRPPKHVSETAFRAANIALSNIGLEIDVFDKAIGSDIIKDTPGIGADV